MGSIADPMQTNMKFVEANKAIKSPNVKYMINAGGTARSPQHCPRPEALPQPINAAGASSPLCASPLESQAWQDATRSGAQLSERIHQVCHRPLPRGRRLRCKAQPGHHGQPPVLDLPHPHALVPLSIARQAQRVKQPAT